MKKQNYGRHPDFRLAIRQAGYKATPARLAILEILQKHRRPLSIQDIQKLLGQKRSVDQTTVYRVLEMLQNVRLVRSVDLHQGRASYELRDPHDHHHIVCVTCGRIEDFSGCDIEPLQKQALRQTPSFKKILEHSLELFGVCKMCAK